MRGHNICFYAEMWKMITVNLCFHLRWGNDKVTAEQDEGYCSSVI